MPSTISVLPAELLLLVCGHAVLTASAESPLMMVTTLLTLTSIDSFWRDIVIGFPPLWTNIHVKLSRASYPNIIHPPRPLPSDFSRVAAFLQRSKEAPVQVTLHKLWNVVDAPWEQERVMIDHDWQLMHGLLALHLGRCWSINCSVDSIRLDHSTDIPRLLGSYKFPLLRELEIGSFFPFKEEMAWGQDWTLSPHETPLEVLRFRDRYRYLPAALDVRWPSLSTMDLRVHRGFWPKICASLAQLPALRELSLKFLGKHHDPQYKKCYARQDRVELPMLKTIVTDNMLIWFDIATPSLSSAAITYYGPMEPLPWLAQEAYIVWLPSETIAEESSWTTELLRLLAELPLHEVIFVRYIPRELNALLGRAFPRVQALRFREGYYQEEVLEGLLKLQASENLLPALKVVSLHYSDEVADNLAERGERLKAVVKRLQEASLDVKWTIGTRVQYDSTRSELK
ncbi:hypothetical protein DL93DRAFT_2228110 [Clavulina sp. PMI_390]|nr:hypothetical protein DL93DRAFT_2228110 [Clavulina sp. PMI_390]